ncbi:MAG: hypothetical protein K0Q95_745 [Bacteroidota bacterium]|jgi:hypothetical protein|nr:hypothetical protein [Bacteroidota bacterium]
MPQEDYLKREIDKLGKVLQKALADLLGLKLKGRIMEGIELTDSVLKEQLDIDLNSLAFIPEDQILSFLYETKKLSNVHVELIADLLFEYAPESSSPYPIYRKALLLYKHVNDNSVDYSINRHFKSESILKLLAQS